jgi:hypothetical protein
MITQSLTVGTWYEFVELDDPTQVFFWLDSSDEVILAFEAGTPSSTSVGAICLPGINAYPVPLGKTAWVKLTSGSADVTYSQFGGILIDQQNCAYAVSDTVTVDEVATNVFPIVGFDVSPLNPLTYVGLLHTNSAGLSSTATINAAAVTLQLSSFRVGRTLRIYGIEEAASVTSGLTDYLSLASGVPLTTAFEDVTIDSSGFALLDLASVLQEIIDDTPSWGTSSPIQLWIGDITGMPTSGLNETATIFTVGRSSALFVRAS